MHHTTLWNKNSCNFLQSVNIWWRYELEHGIYFLTGCVVHVLLTAKPTNDLYKFEHLLHDNFSCLKPKSKQCSMNWVKLWTGKQAAVSNALMMAVWHRQNGTLEWQQSTRLAHDATYSGERQTVYSMVARCCQTAAELLVIAAWSEHRCTTSSA